MSHDTPTRCVAYCINVLQHQCRCVHHVSLHVASMMLISCILHQSCQYRNHHLSVPYVSIPCIMSLSHSSSAIYVSQYACMMHVMGASKSCLMQVLGATSHQRLAFIIYIASTTRIHHLHRINDSHSSSTSHQRLTWCMSLDACHGCINVSHSSATIYVSHSSSTSCIYHALCVCVCVCVCV